MRPRRLSQTEREAVIEETRRLLYPARAEFEDGDRRIGAESDIRAAIDTIKEEAPQVSDWAIRLLSKHALQAARQWDQKQNPGLRSSFRDRDRFLRDLDKWLEVHRGVHVGAERHEIIHEALNRLHHRMTVDAIRIAIKAAAT
jgi:hypothetical protein